MSGVRYVPVVREEGERPRRLSLSEIVAMLLSRTGGEHSSVKLSRNSKGDTQIEVVVRSGDRDAETIEEAAAKTRALYDELSTIYPMSSGGA